VGELEANFVSFEGSYSSRLQWIMGFAEPPASVLSRASEAWTRPWNCLPTPTSLRRRFTQSCRCSACRCVDQNGFLSKIIEQNLRDMWLFSGWGSQTLSGPTSQKLRVTHQYVVPVERCRAQMGPQVSEKVHLCTLKDDASACKVRKLYCKLKLALSTALEKKQKTLMYFYLGWSGWANIVEISALRSHANCRSAEPRQAMRQQCSWSQHSHRALRPMD